jgi:hypothetical protein
MKRRFLAVNIVMLAVLFCQTGGVVLAAICPHVRGPHETCHGMVMAVEPHEMQHADGDALETSDSGATCTHCIIHARNKRDDSALEQGNSAQRAIDLTVSTSVAIANPPALLRLVTWVAHAHGPPRDAGSLYVLINVFRI